MKKLLSIALLLGLGVAAGCSSDSSDSPGSNSSAATGCQQLKDCCATGDSAFQSVCNSGLTQANNNDQVCTGVVQDLQKDGHCGGGAAGSGGGGQAGSGQGGSSQGGSSQAGSNTGGTSGAQAPECTTLEACCATLTAGVKDGCEHIVGLNNAGSCTSILATYQNAGQCKPMAAKVPFSCDTSSSDHKCFDQQADSAAIPALQASCPNGTIGTKCPGTDLIGCCTLMTTSLCYYTSDSGSTADEYAMQCAAAQGTWSTTH
jgi:hypothetical protein